jgi:hypothetical protein
MMNVQVRVSQSLNTSQSTPPRKQSLSEAPGRCSCLSLQALDYKRTPCGEQAGSEASEFY